MSNQVFERMLEYSKFGVTIDDLIVNLPLLKDNCSNVREYSILAKQYIEKFIEHQRARDEVDKFLNK